MTFIILFLVASPGIMFAIQANRMFYIFRKKYPEIARKYISLAFQPYATPEKLLFFFRKNNLHFFKDDPEIWRLRRQVKLWFTLFICLPLTIIFIVLIIDSFTDL